MTKPSKLPRWATDGGAIITEPTEPKKDIGWIGGIGGDKPPDGNVNYWWNLVYLWIKYFDEENKGLNIFNDLAAIKAVDTSLLSTNDLALVFGLGLYRLNKLSTDPDDNETVIKPTTGSGRWIMELAHPNAIFTYLAGQISLIHEKLSDLYNWLLSKEIPSIYGTSITTTTVNFPTLATAINNNFVVALTGKYILSCSYSWNRSITNSDFISKLTFDGTILGKTTENAPNNINLIHRQEVRNATVVNSGGQLAITGSSQVLGFTKQFEITISTVGLKNVLLEISGETGGNNSSIWDVLIELRKV